MKLIRFGPADRESPGFTDEYRRRRDASSLVSDYDRAFFAGSGLVDLADADATRWSCGSPGSGAKANL